MRRRPSLRLLVKSSSKTSFRPTAGRGVEGSGSAGGLTIGDLAVVVYSTLIDDRP
jgi:hypothetical protein